MTRATGMPSADGSDRELKVSIPNLLQTFYDEPQHRVRRSCRWRDVRDGSGTGCSSRH